MPDAAVPETTPSEITQEPIVRARGLARPLAAMIRFYQLGISPLLRSSCRFAPSCSEYAHEALAVHGAGRGLWLALRRLLRCHPFCEGGYDPVPAARGHRAERQTAQGREDESHAHPQSDTPSNVRNRSQAPVTASASATSKEAGECLC